MRFDLVQMRQQLADVDYNAIINAIDRYNYLQLIDHPEIYYLKCSAHYHSKQYLKAQTDARAGQAKLMHYKASNAAKYAAFFVAVKNNIEMIFAAEDSYVFDRPIPEIPAIDLTQAELLLLNSNQIDIEESEKNKALWFIKPAINILIETVNKDLLAQGTLNIFSEYNSQKRLEFQLVEIYKYMAARISANLIDGGHFIYILALLRLWHEQNKFDLSFNEILEVFICSVLIASKLHIDTFSVANKLLISAVAPHAYLRNLSELYAAERVFFFSIESEKIYQYCARVRTDFSSELRTEFSEKFINLQAQLDAPVEKIRLKNSYYNKYNEAAVKVLPIFTAIGKDLCRLLKPGGLNYVLGENGNSGNLYLINYTTRYKDHELYYQFIDKFDQVIDSEQARDFKGFLAIFNLLLERFSSLKLPLLFNNAALNTANLIKLMRTLQATDYFKYIVSLAESTEALTKSVNFFSDKNLENMRIELHRDFKKAIDRKKAELKYFQALSASSLAAEHTLNFEEKSAVKTSFFHADINFFQADRINQEAGNPKNQQQIYKRAKLN